MRDIINTLRKELAVTERRAEALRGAIEALALVEASAGDSSDTADNERLPLVSLRSAEQAVLDLLRSQPRRTFRIGEIDAELPEISRGQLSSAVDRLWAHKAVTNATPEQKKFRRWQHKPVTIRPGEEVIQ